MKATDVRKKTDGELNKLLGELEVELRNFRFGMSGGRTKNIRRSRALRADIARIRGVLTERA
jgi:ribosomal protein L29